MKKVSISADDLRAVSLEAGFDPCKYYAVPGDDGWTYVQKGAIRVGRLVIPEYANILVAALNKKGTN